MPGVRGGAPSVVDVVVPTACLGRWALYSHRAQQARSNLTGRAHMSHHASGLWPVEMRCYARLCGGRRGGDPSMECKRSEDRGRGITTDVWEAEGAPGALIEIDVRGW